MRSIALPLGLAAAISCPSFAYAQSTISTPLPSTRAEVTSKPLTLDAALARASAGSFSLSAARYGAQAADGAVQQAGLFPNPELDVSTEDLRGDARTTTTQLRIPIEIGGKRSARQNAAERGRDVAEAQFRQTQSELRARVVDAFFNVLIAQERLALATSSTEIAADAARVAGRRVAAGKISPVEETRAGVERANAELEAAEAASELLMARQALSSLWGDVTPTFTKAQGELDALPSRPPIDLLIRELENSPAWAVARSELERRQAQIELERSKQYPDVTLSVGAKRDRQMGRNQVIVGVSIPLPLFDRNQGNLYEATLLTYQAQDEHQAVRVRLSNALHEASTQLSLSNESAQALRTTILPAAQQAYQAATKGFEAGKFDFLDVLDAQRTLFQARIRYLTVLAKAYEAAVNIDRIVGR